MDILKEDDSSDGTNLTRSNVPGVPIPPPPPPPGAAPPRPPVNSGTGKTLGFLNLK